MSVEFVGQVTGKIYAKGDKASCFRKLHKKFPSTEINYWNKNTRSVERVYPEALLINYRKGD